MPMMPKPAPRLTTGNAPVQMGKPAPAPSPAPRVTTQMPNPVLAKSFGPKYYAKGGSASARADGIAKKGKTKGKIC